jgi:hypothetical protein
MRKIVRVIGQKYQRLVIGDGWGDVCVLFKMPIKIAGKLRIFNFF